MKHAIYPEATVTVTGSNEDANYPWTNLTDNNYRKKVGKASASQTVTLRCAIASTAEVLTLQKTNAESAICTITLDSAEVELTDGQPAVNLGGGLVKIPAGGHGLSEGDVALINGTDNYDGVHTLPSQASGDASNFVITDTYAAETFSNTDTVCEVVKTTTHTVDEDRIWEEYTEQTAAHTATIELTAGSGEIAEAGIFKAGPLITLVNPLQRPNRRPHSYSIKKQLNNGATYGKTGDVTRFFDYQMIMTHTQYETLETIYKAVDPDPLAILITDNMNDDNLWSIFAQFDGELSTSYISKTYIQVSISLLETV